MFWFSYCIGSYLGFCEVVSVFKSLTEIVHLPLLTLLRLQGLDN